MKKIILVIDDDPDLTEIIKAVLIGTGYEVTTACDGLEGLERLKNITPHLIVLDMNMPRMNGISFYHEIMKGNAGKTKYPVLILTARANLEEFFKDMDVDGFMTKPFEIDQLVKEVGIIISKRYPEKPSALRISGAEVKPKKEKKFKKVLIVDDNPVAFNKIVVTFVSGGYIVNSAKTGTAAIERAMAEPPDIILLKLGLQDLPGDLVASKLKQMPKTMDIPLLLYTPENQDSNYDVTNSICRKIGINDLIETDGPSVLLKESNQLLNAAL